MCPVLSTEHIIVGTDVNLKLWRSKTRAAFACIWEDFLVYDWHLESEL